MSEQSLDKLISTLKSEAIEAAEKKEKEIIDRAKAKAEKIVREAESNKEQLLSEAEKEAEDIIKKGESALVQAARDVVLRVQNDLRKLFASVLERDIQAAFDPDLVKKAVLQVLENQDEEIAIRIPPQLESELTDYIQKQVQASGNLATIATDDSLIRGFSVKKTKQGWSYQVTPEEVSTILSDHLSRKWASIIQNEQTA
jgi:V/A-type H+/Na+-transporting ATPase subunit E